MVISKKTVNYCNKCSKYHPKEKECQSQKYVLDNNCQNDAGIQKFAREIQKKYSCSKPCPATNPDYIVVGLGTAGTLLVRALADKGESVVAFETGTNHTGDPVVEGGVATIFPPAGDASTISFSSKYSVTKLVPDPVNAARLGQLILAEQYTAGTGGGGSSAHNYLLAVRGTDTYWDEVGVISGRPDIWSYFANLERMKSIETYTGTTQKPAERGNEGKIMITQTDGDIKNSPQLLPFAQGLSAVTGAPILSDYNVSGADTAISSNQYFVYPPNGGRSYAINAYLPPNVMKFNGDSVDPNRYPFKVYFETTVIQIIFEGKKAVGVRYEEKEKGVKNIFANKGVIVCAGSPNSAQLLQLSGVGDYDLLDRLHIEKVLNNPNVGKGLQTQYGVSVAISGFLPGGFIGFTGALPYYPDPGRRLQWSVAPFSGLDPGVAALITPPGPFFGAIIWNMKPRSVGSALIVSNSPYTISDIRLNLYTDGDASDPLSDLSASIAAYKLARDWAHAIGQTIIWPPESHFIDGDDSKLAFDALSQVSTATTSHYISTCAMGTSPDTSVVNGKLKVHGLDNLYVADNSTLPIIPDGNTCFPAYDVGAVLANLLCAQVPEN